MEIYPTYLFFGSVWSLLYIYEYAKIIIDWDILNLILAMKTFVIIEYMFN
jgi:hypothetical protein